MTTKTIPAGALCFDAGRVEFASRAAAGKSDGTRVPVTIRARSNQPVSHWYWGSVVHDMAGFRSKPEIPLDYCHDPGEVIGYADEFKAAASGLDVRGALVVFRPNDRAAEIITKQQAGVPYQASIFFDDFVVEEVAENAKAQVNGYSLRGPAAIIRQWELRGVAICPYGKDGNTSTKFSALTAAGPAVVRLLSAAEKARGAERAKLANIYGDGVARFAIGLRLPGKRK